MKRFGVFLLALVIGTCGTQAQEPSKTLLKVDCTCNDPIGVKYASALRDLIAASPRYALTNASEQPIQAGKKYPKYNFVVSIVTVDSNSPPDGTLAAIGTVLTIAGMKMRQWVQVCGVLRYKECALDTLSYIDGEINSQTQ